MSQFLHAIKYSLFESIMLIDDIDELNRIAAMVKKPGKLSINSVKSAKITPAPTFQELYVEQGRKSLTYNDLPAPVDWGYTLDELLQLL